MMSRLSSWINRRRRRKFTGYMPPRFFKDARAPKKDEDEEETPDADLDLDALDEGFPPFGRRPAWMDHTIPSNPFFHGDTSGFFRPVPNVRMDWYEDPTESVLEVELPGVKREDIRLRMEDELLIIEAELPARKQDYRRDYLTSERQTGHLSHPVTLHNIRKDGIRATLADGVLTIVMQRSDPDPAREIIEIPID